MRLQGREVSPTRATAMALRDEEKLIREGYEFLDEKRMLLAQELLRQMKDFHTAKVRLGALQDDALDALAQATARHGLEELSIYPPPYAEAPAVKTRTRMFLGLKLLDVSVDATPPEADDTAPRAAFPSAEAARAADAFRRVLIEQERLAGLTTNLHRLATEYRATERRARALENVLLPETAQAIKTIDEHLEAADQEEALMVRHVKGER